MLVAIYVYLLVLHWLIRRWTVVEPSALPVHWAGLVFLAMYDAV